MRLGNLVLCLAGTGLLTRRCSTSQKVFMKVTGRIATMFIVGSACGEMSLPLILTVILGQESTPDEDTSPGSKHLWQPSTMLIWGGIILLLVALMIVFGSRIRTRGAYTTIATAVTPASVEMQAMASPASTSFLVVVDIGRFGLTARMWVGWLMSLRRRRSRMFGRHSWVLGWIRLGWV